MLTRPISGYFEIFAFIIGLLLLSILTFISTSSFAASIFRLPKAKFKTTLPLIWKSLSADVLTNARIISELFEISIYSLAFGFVSPL